MRVKKHIFVVSLLLEHSETGPAPVLSDKASHINTRQGGSMCRLKSVSAAITPRDIAASVLLWRVTVLVSAVSMKVAATAALLYFNTHAPLSLCYIQATYALRRVLIKRDKPRVSDMFMPSAVTGYLHNVKRMWVRTTFGNIRFRFLWTQKIRGGCATMHSASPHI